MVNGKLRNPRSGFISAPRMRKETKFLSKAKGFTLIELLIVITIIGVLVVAILSAINPIEQIRRARDQGKESDAAELLNAFERYYTAFFVYPWEALGQLNPNVALVSSASGLAWIDELIAREEVKPPFRGRASWSNIYVTQTGTVVYLCFDPASRTFQDKADAAGRMRSGASGCLTSCFTCIPR